MTDQPIAEEMRSEFDTVAGWTEQVVAALGSDYAIPAACRGSGSPSVLAWLAEALEVHRAARFLDAGGGLGGPAAWLVERYGTQVVLAEPMPQAARGARSLFGIPATVAWSECLPYRSDTFDAAWSLGVLCTTPRKAELLDELRRVLVPSGHLGLLVFLAEETLDHQPAGNSFPRRDELDRLLTGAGFWVAETAEVGELPDAPLAWQARTDRVEAEIARRFEDDDEWAVADAQAGEMGRLLAAGDVVATVIHAVAV